MFLENHSLEEKRVWMRTNLFYFIVFAIILTQSLIFQLYFTVAVRIPFDPRLEPIYETFPFIEVSNGPFIMKSFVWIFLLITLLGLGVFYLKRSIIRIFSITLTLIGIIALFIFIILTNSYLSNSINSDSLHVIFYWLFNILIILELWALIAFNSKHTGNRGSVSNSSGSSQKSLFIIVGLILASLFTYITSILSQNSLSWQFVMWTVLLIVGGLFVLSKNTDKDPDVKKESELQETSENQLTNKNINNYGIFTGFIFIILGEYLFLQPLYLREIIEARNIIVPHFPRYLLLGAFLVLLSIVFTIAGVKIYKKKRGRNQNPIKFDWLFSKYVVVFVGFFLFLIYAILRVWNISSGFYLDWESGFITNKPIINIGYLGVIPFVVGLMITAKSLSASNNSNIKIGIRMFCWMIFLHLVNWLLPLLLVMSGYNQGLMFFFDLLITFLGLAFVFKSMRVHGLKLVRFMKSFGVRSKKNRLETKKPISKIAIVSVSLCIALLAISNISSMVVFTNLSETNPMTPRNVEWDDTLFDTDSVPTAPPEWAIAEYNALQAYREWVYYWLDNYDSRGDHTFSGVFEDDVELVQSWSILPFITSDQRVNRTLFDFFETAWNSLYIKDGVWNRAPPGSDIEHIAEPISYLVPPAMLLDYGNETWIQRAYENAIHFGMDWTGINEEGHRHFRSYYANAYDHYLDGNHDCDIPENNRAVKTTLFTAWRDHSPTLLQWLQEFALSWADHATPIDGIKPPGFFPSEVHYETDIEGFYSGNWYSNINDYFSSSWNNKLYDTLLMVYAMTDEFRILDPIEQMLTYLMENQTINDIPTTKMSIDENGEMKWSNNVRSVSLDVLATMWRKITGNTSLDTKFHQWGTTMTDNLIDSNKSLGVFDRESLTWKERPLKFNPELSSRTLGPIPYLSWLTSGDLTNKSMLVKGCENIVEHLRNNYESLTINALDRSFFTPIPYVDHTSGTVEPGGNFLSFMATGGIGSSQGRFPYMPVSYENSSYDITPLVLEENSTHVKVLLYNFANFSRDIGLKLWQLEDGDYDLIAGSDLNEDDEMDSVNQSSTFSVNGDPVIVDINLPSQELFVITIQNSSSTSEHAYVSEFEPNGLKYMHNTQRIPVNNKLYDSQSGTNDVRSWAYATENHTYIYLKTYFEGQNVRVNIKINTILPESVSYQSFNGGSDMLFYSNEIRQNSRIKRVVVTDELSVIICSLDLDPEQIQTIEISVLSTHHNSEIWISSISMISLFVFVVYVIQLKFPFSKWKDFFKSIIHKLTNMAKKPRKLSKKKIVVISSAAFLVLLMTGMGIYVSLYGWSIPTKLPEDAINQITDFSKGVQLYSVSLNDSSDVSDWVMEGQPIVTEFSGDGWMEMYSPNEEFHNVFWCDEVFPDSFYAEWQVRNVETDAGLCIVFFAATGLNNESIFDSSLPERDGTYNQYTKRKINNYAISYYANANGDGRENANLRKNKGFNLVQKGRQGVPLESIDTHNITLIKDSNLIVMFIDGREVINWSDTGRIRGYSFNGGRIGFRQMKWTRFQYANFTVHELA